jgi:phospholipase C
MKLTGSGALSENRGPRGSRWLPRCVDAPCPGHQSHTNNPARLDRSEPLTCDQDHDYTPEQKAFDGPTMDRFVQNTQTTSGSAPDFGKTGLVMDHYDDADADHGDLTEGGPVEVHG